MTRRTTIILFVLAVLAVCSVISSMAQRAYFLTPQFKAPWFTTNYVWLTNSPADSYGATNFRSSERDDLGPALPTGDFLAYGNGQRFTVTAPFDAFADGGWTFREWVTRSNEIVSTPVIGGPFVDTFQQPITEGTTYTLSHTNVNVISVKRLDKNNIVQAIGVFNSDYSVTPAFGQIYILAGSSLATTTIGDKIQVTYLTTDSGTTLSAVFDANVVSANWAGLFVHSTNYAAMYNQTGLPLATLTYLADTVSRLYGDTNTWTASARIHVRSTNPLVPNDYYDANAGWSGCQFAWFPGGLQVQVWCDTSAFLEVGGGGQYLPFYAWYRNGSLYSYQITNTITIDQFAAEQMTAYYGQTGPPQIIGQPQAASVTDGQSTNFTVGVTGTPPYTFQWYRYPNVLIPGATGQTLYFSPAHSADAGSYGVKVSNAYGNVMSSYAALTVATNPTTVTYITPTEGPTNVIVSIIGTRLDLATNVYFGATASPSWTKIDATRLQAAIPTTVSGTNLVRVGTSAGLIGTNNFVVVNESPPSFTVNPTNITVGVGSTAQFDVAATASYGPVYYRWYKAGAILAGQTNASLILSGASFGDAATYYAQTWNNAGSANSSTATLTVTNAGGGVSGDTNLYHIRTNIY